ncbi:hypothetical protein Vadar_020404 [Vaccinium darrowii]|uniref:Uncharacterized protein n=1 Tax=Vaccinium darrowii TaxID=229202 RepID=A0ACB7YZ52_9ERIC|nr:hypothetical protein Vadar_020404 [Vaccinium darrowii]
MSSSDSRIIEKGQISQPVRIAANVNADSNHRKNLSRNGTLDCDVMPSSDTAQSRTLSKLLPFSKSPNPIDGEVLCGRPAVDMKLGEEQMNLAHWIQQCIKKGKVARVIDPSVSGQIAPRCLKSFVVLANNCLHKSPKSRPTMAEVLDSLELALSQQRGRTNGILTKTFHSVINKWLKEMKNISSSSGQSRDLLSSSEDPEIHFKYIKAALKTGQIEEVERVTRESNCYDPEKTKNFLMKAKLRDPQPLINVCDRFGFVPDLIDYLYSNNMLRYIEGYVQKVNPGNALLVVGQLLNDGCPEDFIEGLILSVRSQLLPIKPLVEEFEKRNRLRLLTQFLEHLVNEGSQDVYVHNALGKIYNRDSDNNPDHFLTTNQYYDSRVVGKYCEKRDPTLAVVAYCRGQCDYELISVTNKNALFKLQARYVVERMDGDLWKMVLNPENKFRRQLIDHVASTESKSLAQVSAAVNAFMAAHLPCELCELLEKFLLQNYALSGIFSLQKWRILMAIQALKDQQYTKAVAIFQKLTWIPKRSKKGLGRQAKEVGGLGFSPFLVGFQRFGEANNSSPAKCCLSDRRQRRPLVSCRILEALCRYEGAGKERKSRAE